MSTILWRYFDLLKFIDFLSGNLFFCRADVFEDKFEGRFPKKIVEDYSAIFEYNPLSEGTEEYEIVRGNNEKFMSAIRSQEMKWKECVAISCWHINDYESAAMWGQYARFGYGVAIKTSKEKLDGINIPEDYVYDSFPLSYIDFNHDFEAREQMHFHQLSQFQFKRKSYEHENEYRLMLHKPKNNSDIITFNDDRIPILDNLEILPRSGVNIPIDATELIDKIILSPYLKEWEIKIIEKLIRKFGFDSITSSLLEDVEY